MKKLFVLSLLLLTTAVIHADGLTACIYHNGTLQEKVQLSKKPVIKMEGENITMQLGSQTIEIPAIGTLIKFEDNASVPTKMKSVSVTPTVPAYRIADRSVSMSGLTPGGTVHVYTSDGQLMSSSRVDNNGCASVEIGKGVMILKTGKGSIKIINK